MDAGSGDATADADSPSAELISRRLALGVLAGLVAYGSWLRASGLSSANALFRDDAWVALPARVSLSKAVHMVTTIPLWTLVLRSWIRLDPASQLWAQFPAFVAGVVGIVAIYALSRFFNRSRAASLVVAALVCASPVAIEYSVRVKAYSSELILGALLLWAAERARRRPSVATIAALGGIEVAAYLTSAAVAPIIAAITVVLVVTAICRTAPRNAVALNLAIVGFGCGTVTVVFFTNLSQSLHNFWNPYYLSFSSAHQLVKSSYTIMGGLFHGLTGTPAVTTVSLGSSIVVVCALVVVVVSMWRAVRTRAVELAPAFGALIVSAALAALSIVPLGTGRTDEVLYGPLALLVAFFLDDVLVLFGSTSSTTRRVGVGVFGGIAALALVWGVSNRAFYPTTAVRQLDAKVHSIDPGAPLLVVDASNSYPWAYYKLSSWRLVITNTVDAGFTVRSTAPDVFIAYASPGDPTYTPRQWAADIGASSTVSHLWFFGITNATVSPSDGRLDQRRGAVIHRSPFYQALVAHGWVPGAIVRAPGVFAQSFFRSGSPHHQR